MKIKCGECNKMAVWLYMPGSDPIEDYMCDDHVPRGCSCNEVLKEGVEETFDENGCVNNPPEDWEQPLDSQGRPDPCCEWLYSMNGFKHD